MPAKIPRNVIRYHFQQFEPFSGKFPVHINKYIGMAHIFVILTDHVDHNREKSRDDNQRILHVRRYREQREAESR